MSTLCVLEYIFGTVPTAKEEDKKLTNADMSFFNYEKVYDLALFVSNISTKITKYSVFKFDIFIILYKM